MMRSSPHFISGDEKRQRGPGGTESGSKRGHLGLQDAKGAAVAKSVTSLTALPQYLPPGEPQHLKDWHLGGVPEGAGGEVEDDGVQAGVESAEE